MKNTEDREEKIRSVRTRKVRRELRSGDSWRGRGQAEPEAHSRHPAELSPHPRAREKPRIHGLRISVLFQGAREAETEVHTEEVTHKRHQ